jgi:hypothetical protein
MFAAMDSSCTREKILGEMAISPAANAMIVDAKEGLKNRRKWRSRA